MRYADVLLFPFCVDSSLITFIMIMIIFFLFCHSFGALVSADDFYFFFFSLVFGVVFYVDVHECKFYLRGCCEHFFFIWRRKKRNERKSTAEEKWIGVALICHQMDAMRVCWLRTAMQGILFAQRKSMKSVVRRQQPKDVTATAAVEAVTNAETVTALQQHRKKHIIQTIELSVTFVHTHIFLSLLCALCAQIYKYYYLRTWFFRGGGWLAYFFFLL